MNLADTPEYKSGANLERCMATWLENHGYAVSAVRFGGMVAPTLRAWGRDLVLPDLQFMAPDGTGGWLECKHYQTVGYYEVRGRMRTTGVKLRHWQDYCAVERVTGQPVWIAFGHKEQNEVRLAYASGGGSFVGSGGGAGNRYWPWDDLKQIAELDDVLACDTYAPMTFDRPLFAPPPRQLPLWPGAS